MILHTYLTDGFIDWGELFIKSFRFYHGEDIPILLDARDLNDSQIKRLYQAGKNIKVNNKEIPYKELSKRLNLPINKIKKAKQNIEKGKQKGAVFWKQYISVEDRYRNTIPEVVKQHLNSSHSHLLHMDIDMYFNKPAYPIFELVEKNDISIRFRPRIRNKHAKNQHKSDKRPPKRCVLGNIIGFKLDPSVLDFFEVWSKHIDKIPLQKKPAGYGQESFWYSFLETKNKYKWGNLHDLPRVTGLSTYCADGIVATGNKGNKKDRIKEYWNDFNRKASHKGSN